MKLEHCQSYNSVIYVTNQSRTATKPVLHPVTIYLHNNRWLYWYLSFIINVVCLYADCEMILYIHEAFPLKEVFLHTIWFSFDANCMTATMYPKPAFKGIESLYFIIIVVYRLSYLNECMLNGIFLNIIAVMKNYFFVMSNKVWKFNYYRFTDLQIT